MAALALVRRAAFFTLSTTCAWTPAALAEPPRAARSRPTCLSATEAREEVRSHNLLGPFAALKVAAAQRKAEALPARLCHAGDEFFYEITLLHRDGRLVHVEMNASSRRLIPPAPRETIKPPAAREAQEPPTKECDHTSRTIETAPPISSWPPGTPTVRFTISVRSIRYEFSKPR